MGVESIGYNGIKAVQLFTDEGNLLREIIMHPGDAIVLIRGVRAISFEWPLARSCVAQVAVNLF